MKKLTPLLLLLTLKAQAMDISGTFSFVGASAGDECLYTNADEMHYVQTEAMKDAYRNADTICAPKTATFTTEFSFRKICKIYGPWMSLYKLGSEASAQFECELK